LILNTVRLKNFLVEAGKGAWGEEKQEERKLLNNK